MKKTDPQENDNNSVTYQTTILQTGKNTTGIPVPEEIVEKLDSGKRPRVRVTINSYTYLSTVATMNGEFMISLSAKNREAAGVQGGEEVAITLVLDSEPRTVQVPEDLKTALINAKVLDSFEKSAPSKKKEYIRQVVEAKKQETRERRIAKIVEKLK
jgi:hypothetical protein